MIGFHHSAFTLCNEAQLKECPHFTKHIPRGELIELLGKALLYIEVESHWKADGLTANCQSGFSLLEPHVCSLDPPTSKLNPILPTPSDASEKDTKANGTVADLPMKRKASPQSTDTGPSEKRTKRDQEDMSVDLPSECRHSCLRFYFSHPSLCSRKSKDSRGCGQWDWEMGITTRTTPQETV
jgi:hypothetical protein